MLYNMYGHTLKREPTLILCSLTAWPRSNLGQSLLFVVQLRNKQSNIRHIVCIVFFL